VEIRPSCTKRWCCSTFFKPPNFSREKLYGSSFSICDLTGGMLFRAPPPRFRIFMTASFFSSPKTSFLPGGSQWNSVFFKDSQIDDLCFVREFSSAMKTWIGTSFLGIAMLIRQRFVIFFIGCGYRHSFLRVHLIRH